MDNHRVNQPSAHLHAQAREHHHIELYVLRNLRNRLIFKQWAHRLGKCGGILGRERHIPRLVRLNGKRHTHDAVAEVVETCCLGVETYLFITLQLRHKRL